MILSKEEYETLARAMAELNNMADLLGMWVRFNSGTTVSVFQDQPAVRIRRGSSPGVKQLEDFTDRSDFTLAYDKEYGQ